MTGSGWTLAVAVLTLTGACGRNDRAVAAADTSAAGGAPADSTAATSLPTRIEGLQNPESAKYDKELDVWYVSNINGAPTAKDGNGYISRLHGDGTMDSLKFITSGVNGVKLDGPKGLALQDDTLWVADIHTVRPISVRSSFSESGRSLCSV